MFGYVTINKMELVMKEYYRYQGYYCGLCRVLKNRYGRMGQFTLTYDMTFLIILLTSLYEKDGTQFRSRCLAHPGNKHLMIVNEITEYAADLNIIMAYYNLKDDWDDERKVTAFLAMKLLEKKHKKAVNSYSRQKKVIEQSLQKLDECERKEEMNLDIVSDCFGFMMGEMFVLEEDRWQTILREMGKYLGKFIYLMDAYEDFDKDRKENRYNPLRELADHELYQEEVEDILNLLMAECVRNFEKLPLIEETGILKNILYKGVWVKFNQLKEKNKIGKDEK